MNPRESAEFFVQPHPARVAIFGLNPGRERRLPGGLQTSATTAEARQRFFDLAAQIRSPDFAVDPELVELGEKAAARLKANEDEDVEKWASHLADDLGKLKD